MEKNYNKIGSTVGINNNNYYSNSYTDRKGDILNKNEISSGKSYNINRKDNLYNKEIIFGEAKGETDESGVENIVQILTNSKHSSQLKYAIEEQLIIALCPANCRSLLLIAERYALQSLKDAAIKIIESLIGCKTVSEESHKCVFGNASYTSENNCIFANDFSYNRYTAVFTVNISKRAVQVVVLDSEQDVKCHRYLEQGKEISAEFKACCLHDSKEDTSFLYWTCGKTFFKYDTIMNRNKACKPLTSRRCNFTLVGHAGSCFVIGGIHQGQRITDIEEYNVKTNSWRRVASLPSNIHTTNLSCVSVGNVIYMFVAFDQQESLQEHELAVCLFNPDLTSINIIATIPVKTLQIRTCVLGKDIYIASSNGDFLKFNTESNLVKDLQRQNLICKEFGLYTCGNAVYLAGGVNTSNAKLNDVICKFSPLSGTWQNLCQTLPDQMPIYASCEIKVCRKPETTIVPFYENNYMEIR